MTNINNRIDKLLQEKKQLQEQGRRYQKCLDDETTCPETGGKSGWLYRLKNAEDQYQLTWGIVLAKRATIDRWDKVIPVLRRLKQEVKHCEQEATALMQLIQETATKIGRLQFEIDMACSQEDPSVDYYPDN